ncbi:MAG: hypothetical protein H7Z42_02400 [Roseiflexaceae bacterium]|nr:hypothetical protein [Roseiflexaceae bacterium]
MRTRPAITFALVIVALCWLGITPLFAATNRSIFIPLVQRATGTNPPPVLPPIVASARWSDPTTWPSGRVPIAGEAVVIATGKNVLLDITPPPLKSLTIAGTLVFDQKDLALEAGWIMLHDGTLAIGSEQQPFTNKATITLNATDPTEEVMGMGTRGVLLMGKSRLDLFGSAPTVAWTQLGDHAAAGSTKLTLKEAVSWRTGDQIVVAPTDFRYAGATERLEAATVAGSTVNLRTGLQKPRWGKLQYVTASGMTLTPDTSVTPLVLDERAEVGNLTRNIVIQGADDALWSGQGFGAQFMAMEGSVVRINGVELRRMGQRSKARRYPIHFHGLSYRVDGTILADASGSFVRNSAIWNSQNRCLVIHGTNGVLIQNNICYDIVGHAMFLEDGVEQRNTFDHNLVLKVRNPAEGQELLKHESGGTAGSSGYWLTHPNNAFRNNVAADTDGHGIWYAFPSQPLGLFKNAPIFAPKYTAFGSFDNNVAHSNRLDGLHMDNAPKNDEGELEGISYRPTADGKDPGNVAFEASLPFTLSRLTSYKNDSSALWHRQGGGTFDKFIVADNPSTGFRGSANCIIKNSASIGNSLNNATPINPNDPSAGLASYHSSCDVSEHLFVNLPLVPGKISGAINTFDYYIRPVDKGLFRDSNLRFINAPFGYRQPPIKSENWTLAGALWDPYGYAGPKGNYWTLDDPFLTDGTTCQDVAPAGQAGKSCAGPYYGLYGFVLENANPPWGALMPIRVERSNGAVWDVGDGNTAPKLGNMRHAALVKNGEFTLTFPGSSLPKNIHFGIENMLSANDSAILAVQYSGAVNEPWVYGTTDPNPLDVKKWDNWATSPRVRMMTPVGSIDEVRSSDGTKYYQDKANNLIYIKLRNGLEHPWKDIVPGSDDDLYRNITFVINER